MKTKNLIMAIFCLFGLTFVGCEKDTPTTPTTTNDLDGTKWQAKVEKTDVEASFIDDECYLTMSGYANGVIRGSYKTSSPNVFITVTHITGDADGQVEVGDVISGTYDIKAKTMSIKMRLYGSMQTIIFTMADGDNNNKPTDNTPVSIVGKWFCNKVFESEDNDYEEVAETLTVNEDNTFSWKGLLYDISGTWIMEGYKIYGTSENGSTAVFTITKLKQTEMVLRSGESAAYEDFYFTRLN